MTSTVAAAAAGIRATDEPQARLHSKVFWRIVPFLMLCYVIANLDRVNVGFAKLQMGQDLASATPRSVSVPACFSSATSCSSCRATC